MKKLTHELSLGVWILGMLGATGLMTVPAHAQAVPEPTTAENILMQSDGGTCDPQKDQTNHVYGLDCCGSPGRRECSVILHWGKGDGPGCTDPSSNILRDGKSNSGGRDYVCDLSHTVQPEATGLTTPTRGDFQRDFTFYITSDLHYYRSDYNVKQQVSHVARINALAENPIPWAQFGTTMPQVPMSPPLAVVALGDLTTGGNEEMLGAYRLMWEPWRTADSIHFPVYPGLGNHDVGTSTNYGANSVENAQRMWKYVADRTAGFNGDRNGAGCLVGVNAGCEDQSIDGGSLSYSWNWQGVHMVMLQVYAGDIDLNYTPRNKSEGFAWLQRDLLKYATGKTPVILFQHFNLDNDDTHYPSGARTALLNTIQGYNVIALYSGHTHKLSNTSTLPGAVNVRTANSHPTEGWTQLDNIMDGSGGDCGSTDCSNAKPNILAVHVTDEYMDVGALTWDNAYTTGSMYFDATIKFNGSNAVCRKRLSPVYFDVTASAHVALNSNNTVTVTNTSNSPLMGTLALKIDGSAKWDFVDSCNGGNGAQFAAGSKYMVVTQQNLAPGASVTIPVYGDVHNISTSGLYSLNDSITAGTNGINVDSSTKFGIGVPLTLGSVSGDPVGFKIISDPWLRISASAGVTPATLTFGINPGQTAPASGSTVVIVPNDWRIPPFVLHVLPYQLATITANRPGHTILVDGNPSVIPNVFAWAPGSTHTLNGSYSATPTAGSHEGFVSWGGGQPASFTFTMPSSSAVTTLSAVFGEYYQLSLSTVGQGSVTTVPSSADGTFASGTVVSVHATPEGVFGKFSGDLSGRTNPQTITMSGPKSVTATFTVPNKW